MERMKTQVELLKECGDIKDAACVRYQKRIAELEEENEKLEDDNNRLREGVDAGQKIVEDLISKNKKLKEAIKDHQLYEEKLEHRIIEFEELLHGE